MYINKSVSTAPIIGGSSFGAVPTTRRLLWLRVSGVIVPPVLFDFEPGCLWFLASEVCGGFGLRLLGKKCYCIFVAAFWCHVALEFKGRLREDGGFWAFRALFATISGYGAVRWSC